MSDQLRWFKLWATAPSDPEMLALPPAIRWAWAALACYTVRHGTRGVLETHENNPVLAAEMGIDPGDLLSTVAVLPHVTFSVKNGEHGQIIVTWRNWYKFQVDSTHAARQRRARSKKRGEISSVVSSKGASRGAPQLSTKGPPPCGCGSSNCDRKYWGHMVHSGDPGRTWDQCGCWNCRKAMEDPTNEASG